jgi:hypothetical protein
VQEERLGSKHTSINKAMLKPILTFFAGACMLAASAQQFPYELTVLNQPYQNIMDPSTLTSGADWDDFDEMVDLGFEFVLMGDTIESVVVSDPGAQVYALGKTTVSLISPTAADVINADTLNAISFVGYTLEGLPGNRIFKIEWNNTGLYYEAEIAGTYTSRCNWQVWLYEQGSIIEFHYGINTVPSLEYINEFGGPAAIFIDDLDFKTGVGNSWALVGSISNPDILAFNIVSKEGPGTGLQSIPPSGTVYRFAPAAPVSITPVAHTAPALRIWPTQAVDHITIAMDASSKPMCIVRDLSGREIERSILVNDVTVVDINNYRSGVYFLQIQDGVHVITRRFVKE